MVGDGCECSVAVPCRFRRRFGGLRVWFEQLYLAIRAACDQLLVSCPAHALDYVLVCARLPYLFPACEVPYFDDTVAAARCKVFERVGILCEGVYTVDMARFETAEEGLRKHALDFGGIEGSRILSRALEWMSVHGISTSRMAVRTLRCSQIRVQVPRYFCYIRTWRLGRSRRPAECLDLHLGVSWVSSL